MPNTLLIQGDEARLELTNKRLLRLRTYSRHLYSMKFFHFNSTSVERSVYCLTSVVEALKSFQYFSLNIRAAAIALHADLEVAQ